MNGLKSHIALLLGAALITGCTKNPTDPQDPYENYNRNIYHLNNTVDRTLYRPAAVIYKSITPPPLRQGITNALDNAFMPKTFINDLLQGKIHYAIRDIGRFVFNTTLGLGGLIDVASRMHINKHENDFGKTFAFYSQNKKSAYVMLPFLGPCTIRDSVAYPFDVAANPITYFNTQAVVYGVPALYFINLRAQLLPLNKMIDESFDPYAAIRNAYLQRRNAEVIRNAEMGDYKFGQLEESHQPLKEFVGQSNNTVEPPADDDFSINEPSKAHKKNT